jgi:hypothetical protein
MLHREVRIAKRQLLRFGTEFRRLEGFKKTHSEGDGKGFTGDVRSGKQTGWFCRS